VVGRALVVAEGDVFDEDLLFIGDPVAVIVAALGYLVDIYDLLLFSMAVPVEGNGQAGLSF